MNIEELKRLAAEATPGPWFAVISSNMNNSVHVSMGIICDTGKNIDDAVFIAAANPAAVLDLIAEVERVTKQRGEWQRQAEEIITERNKLETQRDELLAALKRFEGLFPSDEYMKSQGKVPGPELIAMRAAITKAEG